MKKVLVILITLLICICLVSCSANNNSVTDETVSATAEQSSSDPETTEEQITSVATEYGNISYPAEYKDSFVIDQQREDDILNVVFNTEVDGEEFSLFTVSISDSEGDSVGVITDSNGTERNVFVGLNELDVSDLSEDQKDQLYAMQESINFIIEHLQ